MILQKGFENLKVIYNRAFNEFKLILNTITGQALMSCNKYFLRI